MPVKVGKIHQKDLVVCLIVSRWCQCIWDIDHESISNFATENPLTGNFNPPQSPHMGGAWEDMVCLVKISLRVILKEQPVGDFTPMTVLTKVQTFLNSRSVGYESKKMMATVSVPCRPVLQTLAKRVSASSLDLPKMKYGITKRFNWRLGTRFWRWRETFCHA